METNEVQQLATQAHSLSKLAYRTLSDLKRVTAALNESLLHLEDTDTTKDTDNGNSNT